MYEPSRQYLNCNVAGFSHWYGLEVIGDMKVGGKLDLVSEPDNPYDSQAVAVYFKGTKIGFVPESCNGTLSKLIFFGHGDVFEARIASVNTEKDPEHQVRMTIFVTDARDAEKSDADEVDAGGEKD